MAEHLTPHAVRDLWTCTGPLQTPIREFCWEFGKKAKPAITVRTAASPPAQRKAGKCAVCPDPQTNIRALQLTRPLLQKR